jgi:hypothetical protein
MTLITIQGSSAITAAQRKTKPGALILSTVRVIPMMAAGTNKAGTSRRSCNTSAFRSCSRA